LIFVYGDAAEVGAGTNTRALIYSGEMLYDIIRLGEVEGLEQSDISSYLLDERYWEVNSSMDKIQNHWDFFKKLYNLPDDATITSETTIEELIYKYGKYFTYYIRSLKEGTGVYIWKKVDTSTLTS